MERHRREQPLLRKQPIYGGEEIWKRVFFHKRENIFLSNSENNTKGNLSDGCVKYTVAPAGGENNYYFDILILTQLVGRTINILIFRYSNIDTAGGENNYYFNILIMTQLVGRTIIILILTQVTRMFFKRLTSEY